MEWTWLFLFIVLLFIEALTFNFITIWFAVGALGAFVATYVTGSVMIQLIVFATLTVISLLATRPLAKKLVRGHDHIKTNLDSVVGSIGIVHDTITDDKMGRVSVLGKDWAAISNETIKTGSKVEILAIEGVKLIVRKREEK